MRIIDDFQCKNEECPEYDKLQELLYERGTEVPCPTCDKIMKKKIGTNPATHHSWSSWRM